MSAHTAQTTAVSVMRRIHDALLARTIIIVEAIAALLRHSSNVVVNTFSLPEKRHQALLRWIAKLKRSVARQIRRKTRNIISRIKRLAVRKRASRKKVPTNMKAAAMSDTTSDSDCLPIGWVPLKPQVALRLLIARVTSDCLPDRWLPLKPHRALGLWVARVTAPISKETSEGKEQLSKLASPGNMSNIVGRSLIIASVLMTMVMSVSMAPKPATKEFMSTYPVGDARWCVDRAKKTDFTLTRLEVLPGGGWDNLRNLELGMVAQFNFSLCKVTDDGGRLIPDDVNTVPIKTSAVDKFASIIDSVKKSSSLTASSINLNVEGNYGAFSASGSLSLEQQSLKKDMVTTNSVVMRVELRFVRYEVKLEPDFALAPRFRKRLLLIAKHIQLGHTEKATYFSQLVVRDFGTHILTSVTAGATLAKDDFIQKSLIQKETTDITAMKAAATAEFSKGLASASLSASYSSNNINNKTESYKKSITNSKIRTYGGPTFGASGTMKQWQDSLRTNLVAIDRSGLPLSYVITQEVFPRLAESTVFEMQRYIKKAIEDYYRFNTVIGCMDTDSEDFEPLANVDEDSCNDTKKDGTRMVFGGFYTACIDQGVIQQGFGSRHQATNRYACPKHFMSVPLLSGLSSSHFTSHNKNTNLISYGNCTIYWCSPLPSLPKDATFSVYHFGGMYSLSIDNLFTNDKKCPKGFDDVYLTGDVKEWSTGTLNIINSIVMCLSDNHAQPPADSIPIGGLFSCRYGNPLAVSGNGTLTDIDRYNRRCPDGFKQHMGFDYKGCTIHYCIGALKQKLHAVKIKMPPFIFPFDLDIAKARKNIIKNDGKTTSFSPSKLASVSVIYVLACVTILIHIN